MPLAFSSLSHGTVAFGFYNVETDGLLLDRHFFFCTDFCRAVETLAADRADPRRATLPAHVFEDSDMIGDLRGAIHGVRLEGFLGAVYRRWPFPTDSRAFRQRLEGHVRREAVAALLADFAAAVALPFEAEREWARVRAGPYLFSRWQFRELLRYLWRGGHPRWERAEEGCRPGFVEALAPVLEALDPDDEGDD